MTRSGMALWLIVLVAGSTGPRSAASPVDVASSGPVRLILYEHHAVVRETISATLPATSTVIRLTDFSKEVDASSLALVGRRGDLRLREWRLPSVSSPDTIRASVAGQKVQIDMQPAPTPLESGIELTLDTASPGEKRFDLVYIMTGVTWKVTYDVLLRGDLSDISSPLSIDVDGWIELSNTTARTFRNARLSLIGVDTLGESPEPKSPGILELDDNTPLADMWRYQEPESRPSHVYPFDKVIDLPAHRTTLFAFVSVVRKPVDRILVLRAEEIPTDTRSHYATPSQLIRFENAKDYGGNRAVPPGTAMVHLGNQRLSLHQKAWFKHTPAQGEIRLDMGKLNGVRARRVDRGRRDVAGGYVEQVFELRIENTFDKPIMLIIDEQPPTTLTWTPQRANHPYERLDRRLIFKPTIEPKSELIIQYTVRIEMPGK
jgi:hypothetical protein